MGLFSSGNILYYPGCLSKFVLKDEVENYKKILDKLGVDFILPPDAEFACCGSPVLNAGYEKDARRLARKNFETLKKFKIKKIITNCPACYKTFKQYKDFVPDWDIETEHISITIFRKLNAKPKLIKNQQTSRVVYHDPCHLGRHSGIYDEPRLVLSLLGFNVVDMANSRENSFCCGAGAGLRTNNPKIATAAAKQIVKQAETIGAEKIITTCPLCFKNIEENSQIKVEEFSHAIALALGVR